MEPAKTPVFISIRLPSSLYADKALVDVGRALSLSVVDVGDEVGETADMEGTFDDVIWAVVDNIKDEGLVAGVLGMVSGAGVAIDDGNVDLLLDDRGFSIEGMIVDGWVGG
jgi:hypothetical protein